MFHRAGVHEVLMDSTMGKIYSGISSVLKLNHRCSEINHRNGTVYFGSGAGVKYDSIIAQMALDLRHDALWASCRTGSNRRITATITLSRLKTQEGLNESQFTSL